MNALQAKLAEMRGTSGTIPKKQTMADIIAKHKLNKLRTPAPNWTPGEEQTEIFEMYKGCNIKELICAARYVFPRLNIREIRPNFLQVEGAGEIRWFQWFVGTRRF